MRSSSFKALSLPSPAMQLGKAASLHKALFYIECAFDHAKNPESERTVADASHSDAALLYTPDCIRKYLHFGCLCSAQIGNSPTAEHLAGADNLSERQLGPLP